MNNTEVDEEISISSLASLDDEILVQSKHAMVMMFLCKKRSNRRGSVFEKSKIKQSKFSINLSNSDSDTKIRTKFLIQALHDIADIFGAHHEKIFAR